MSVKAVAFVTGISIFTKGPEGGLTVDLELEKRLRAVVADFATAIHRAARTTAAPLPTLTATATTTAASA